MAISAQRIAQLKMNSMISPERDPLRCELDVYEYPLFDLNLYTQKVIDECIHIIQSMDEQLTLEQRCEQLRQFFATDPILTANTRV
jgi:hypothetical protein